MIRPINWKIKNSTKTDSLIWLAYSVAFLKFWAKKPKNSMHKLVFETQINKVNPVVLITN